MGGFWGPIKYKLLWFYTPTSIRQSFLTSAVLSTHTHTDLRLLCPKTISSPLCCARVGVTCSPLLSPQNGTMSCVHPPGDSSYNSTCWFTCDEGFSLSGPGRLACAASGHWTGSPPACEGRIIAALPCGCSSQTADPAGGHSSHRNHTLSPQSTVI